MKKCAKTAWTIDENDQLCTLEQGDTQCDAYTVEAYSIKEALQIVLSQKKTDYIMSSCEDSNTFSVSPSTAELDEKEDEIQRLKSRIYYLEKEVERKEDPYFNRTGRRPIGGTLDMIKALRTDFGLGLAQAKGLVDYLIPTEGQRFGDRLAAINRVKEFIKTEI